MKEGLGQRIKKMKRDISTALFSVALATIAIVGAIVKPETVSIPVAIIVSLVSGGYAIKSIFFQGDSSK